MTTAQVVETSVTVNGPIQDYVHPDDQTQPTFGNSFLFTIPMAKIQPALATSKAAE